jgi:uncharacterized protein (DUF2236 family)
MDDAAGYFGPDSVTWVVHREPTALVGGLRALILQAVYPPAMQLLAKLSNFRDEPWARLERTAGYVADITFGTTETADAAAARVRRIHAALGIDDPDMLLWVHCCEVDSFLSAARYAGLRLNRGETDRYVAEQVQAARLVGLDPSATGRRTVPRSTDQLAGYFARMRPELAVSPEARQAALLVLAPPMPVPARYALPARLGWTALASLAVGLLPGWARRLYRLPPLPGTTLATSTGMRSLRLAISALPPALREGPAYRDAKARLALAS